MAKLTQQEKEKYILSAASIAENKELKEFIKITLGLIITLGIMFFGFNFLTKNRNYQLPTFETEVNVKKITKNQILSMPKEKYLVYIYNPNNSDQKEESVMGMTDLRHIYYVNAADHLSKDLMVKTKGEEKLTKNINDFKVYKDALIEVKNGKIEKVIEDTKLLSFLQEAKGEK